MHAFIGRAKKMKFDKTLEFQSHSPSNSWRKRRNTLAFA